jgi:AraC-like DNA-binding protein
MLLEPTGRNEGFAERVNWRSFEYYPALSKVRCYIDEKFHSPLSLTVVAGVAGMEPTYFSSYFHRKVGVRLTDWIWRVRVSAAMRILAASDQSISATAYSVGFADVRTFERAFKRIAQITPREFKRQARPA